VSQGELVAPVPSRRAMSTAAPLTAADVFTAAEVAELLHMPTSTVEDLARRGVIFSRKVGRRRLFLRSRVEALLEDIV
jgi:excisionase family DNA binding protein